MLKARKSIITRLFLILVKSGDCQWFGKLGNYNLLGFGEYLHLMINNNNNNDNNNQYFYLLSLQLKVDNSQVNGNNNSSNVNKTPEAANGHDTSPSTTSVVSDNNNSVVID